MTPWVLSAGLALATFIVSLWAWRLRAQLREERAQAALRLVAGAKLAAEQAAAEERDRIHADLHDDLGARLLGLVHAADNPRQAELARALLQDLRKVVTRARGTPGRLGDVLADIRAETSQRLAAAGIALDWQVHDTLPDPPLDSGSALHLQRIVREAVSNVIRHARARQLRIRAIAGEGRLCLELTDDGSGAGVDAAASGRGLRGMRVRAAELEGAIDWRTGTAGGTKVLLTMPLQASP